MHCGPSTSESNMAKKKQTWREPSRYSSDEEENDAKRDHFPKDKMLVTHISRPRESFDHPVFKKLSRANNLVNSMSAEEITNKLRELGLSDKGHLSVTSKRLKNWIKTTKLKEENVKLKGSSIDYLVVIDFEATCEKGSPEGFRQEIIEFPAVLINVEKREMEAEFHSYCKPVINGELTHFCTSLTGITQGKVESAPLFPTVMKRFDAWLRTVLRDDDKFVILTDGPWDIARFLSYQCKYSKITLPHYFNTWCNIRRHFRNYYRFHNQNLEGMLDTLGLSFIGRPHSGIDDTRNIARIAIQLLYDGCDLSINETFG